jgi:DNA topoisomerase-1
MESVIKYSVTNKNEWNSHRQFVMRVLIVESPAKCPTIQGFLGPGNKVIASMGHIRSLVASLDSVGITRGFEPTYEFMKEKAKAIANLKTATSGAKEIILCADDDREGEAIAYSVAILLKLNIQTNPRATFREITKRAVLDALAKPRTIDMNRVNSQQTRSMLDMMIGFTVSPILWKHMKGVGLSAGRCQTPALRLLCEREKEATEFQRQSVWNISGQWSLGDAHMIDSLSDEESAMNYLENHSTESGATIRSIVTKPWTEQPPLALMTSSLQQQVSNLFKIAPKRTMQIAQKLYEAGHITYMRTDQTTMSQEAQEQAKKIIGSLFGAAYSQSSARVSESKHAQEAHEAIRPTHFEVSKLPDSCEAQEKKIYRLIWLRAIQSMMTKASGELREILFDADTDDMEFPWKATWKRTLFQGWKKADEKETDLKQAREGEDGEEEELCKTDWSFSETCKVKDRITWKKLSAKPKESRPPMRYTDATVVRELEKRGIGRPSTFASLVDTLLEKSYAEITDIPTEQIHTKIYSLDKLGGSLESESFIMKRGGEKRRMIPTAMGKQIVEFILKHFPNLFAYEFTAGMETRLDAISEGKELWKTLLEDTWNSYKDTIQSLKHAVIVQPKKAEEERLGEWKGAVVKRKVGQYGPYAEWNGKKTPLKEGDTLETIIQRLEVKKAVGQFQINTGPYGPYMYRIQRGKKPVYISIPKDTDIDGLTVEKATEIYEAGLKEKATMKKWKPKK